MAGRNYFSDPFSTGQAAFAQGYDTMQGVTDQIRRRKAGRALAGGDRQGAMQAFGEAGMTDDVRQLQQDDIAADERAYERQRNVAQDARLAKQDEVAEMERRVDVMTRVAQGLKTVPKGQRKAALQRAYPIFQQMKIDTGMFDGLDETQLDDAQLDMFTGELEKAWQGVNLGAGGYGAFNPRSGEFKTIREPNPKLQVIGNGAVAIDPETGDVVARNPKTFSPKGGASSGGAKLPNGFILDQ